MKKEKNTDGPPGCSPWILQTDFGLSPTIMPQGIVILHFPPASVMINKNLSILEIYYFRIHHPSLFLMNLRHSKTWNFWHFHNTIIRLLCSKNIKLCLVLFTTKTSHTNNIFCTEVLVNTVSMIPPRPIESIFNQWNSINSSPTHF